MSDDQLSDEDKALFKAAVASVKPLRKKEILHDVKKKPPNVIKNKSKNTKEHCVTPHRYLSDYIREEVFSETVLSYFKTGLQNKRFQALKRGLIHVEALLDLHGYKGQDLASTLSDFIIRNALMGTKCVLLIHGKGGQQSMPPIIKNLVNCYLPQFEEVIAFHSALPKHGGTGALYVLLKAPKTDL